MNHFQEFSAGYYIAPDVSVEAFSGENVVVPYDLHEQISELVGLPAYGSIGGCRFKLRPEHGIPADTVAVPQEQFSSDDTVLLIERPGEGGRFL